MSSDILKQAVFDDRIVQHQPRYAVEKGALAVTNSPFQAIAANASQHTYNILVPSENVFIDRAADWTTTVYLQATFYANTTVFSVAPPTPAGGLALPGSPLPQFGNGELALCAFPLQSMATTLTATINDTTVTLNASDVLPQVLRMTDYKKNRTVRTCPTMLDRYVNYQDGAGAINTPLGGFNEAMNVDEVPNGAFGGVVWTDPQGNPLFNPNGAGGTLTYQSPGANGRLVAYNSATGIPCIPLLVGDATYDIGSTWTVYFAVTCTEKLCLSPFVFADTHEWDTGLFGCQNIQLVMNLQQPSRLVRSSSSIPYPSSPALAAGSIQLAPGTVNFNNTTQFGTPFQKSVVNIQFLTPSLDVPLPPKSVVPYMEFPRYISGNLGSLNPGQPTNFSSQTITLPTIPDLLIIWARPVNAATGLPYTRSIPGTAFSGGDTTVGDWMLPISQISINFDNFAGLLSSHTQAQLYKMSVHNGLEMDWQQWSGVAQTSSATNPPLSYGQYGKVATVGGMLVLKPGRDIALQAGQAPGLVGNFVLQFNATLTNYSSVAVQPQFVVVTANSGFFETIKGSSRIVKGVLTEQDIISAPMAPGGTHGALRRAVGSGVLGSLGNALSHVKGMYDAAKPYASAVKDCLTSVGKHTGNRTASKVANAMGSVGMGRSLADRLM